jgi:hypothetical protein
MGPARFAVSLITARTFFNVPRAGSGMAARYSSTVLGAAGFWGFFIRK